MADWYDPITERWHKMPTTPAIGRAKPPTMAECITARAEQTIRIAEYAQIWQAIEATATATQMSGSVDVETPID